ncbi:MAG: Uncharacterised protein [Marinobacterium sp. xm-d-530]|jgi:hypothetical protein|nr:MAG: Uncharacterised protein [Marinobacterium sp. xm-d-530]
MSKFKAGQSGNPNGRPKGSKNRHTELREALKEDLPELLVTLKERALAGDMAAMRLLLDRVMPSKKQEANTVDIPELEEAESFQDKADAILSAVALGKLAPEHGVALINAIGSMVKPINVDVAIAKKVEEDKWDNMLGIR